MSKKEKYQPTEKGAAFLATVENGKYKREIVTGLAKFIKKEVPEEMQDFTGFYPVPESSRNLFR